MTSKSIKEYLSKNGKKRWAKISKEDRSKIMRQLGKKSAKARKLKKYATTQGEGSLVSQELS